MDIKSKKAMNKHYSALYKKYGNDPRTICIRDKVQSDARFKILSDIMAGDKTASVLDVGAGLGHLYDYLRAKGWRGQYLGVDINPDLVKAAQKRMKKDNFAHCVEGNILEGSFVEAIRWDYVICGATLEHRPKFGSYKTHLKYFADMINKMFLICQKGVAFDIFNSKTVDYKEDYNLYIYPVNLLLMAYDLTPRIVLRADQRPFEVVMYLYKQTEKNEFNIFTEWKGDSK